MFAIYLICYYLEKVKGKSRRDQARKYLYEDKTPNMWLLPKSQTLDCNTHTNPLGKRKYLITFKSSAQ